MAKKDKNEREGAKKIMYIKAKSLDDIVRYACRFDSSPGELLSAKVDGEDRLIALGESIDDSNIAYYTSSTTTSKIIKYDFGASENKIEFIHSIDQKPNSQYIEIVSFETFPFKTTKTLKKELIAQIKVKGSDDLIKSVIRKAVEKEEIGSAYVFSSRGKTYIAAFDIIESLTDSLKTFYYAEMHNYKNEEFARYDYSKNTIDFSDEFGEHTYLYVKLIKLAEPFPFFTE